MLIDILLVIEVLHKIISLSVVYPHMIYEHGELEWNDIDRGNGRTRRETWSSATLSTTNPTWNDPGVNPGFSYERPDTNRLSHGTAVVDIKLYRNEICLVNEKW
jgi:hypothetical protein